MWLKRISILNYKNLEQVELAFSHKMNCIIGKNGMGKTNLLDAVYYLSFAKVQPMLLIRRIFYMIATSLSCKDFTKPIRESLKRYIAD